MNVQPTICGRCRGQGVEAYGDPPRVRPCSECGGIGHFGLGVGISRERSRK